MNADPWKEYRRRRRMLLWAALAGLALFAACFRLAQVRHAAGPFYVGLALFVGAVAWAAIPLAEFICPNCGETFACRGKGRNLFTRVCLHCQHPKWGAKS